jgi:hypothetical protein
VFANASCVPSGDHVGSSNPVFVSSLMKHAASGAAGTDVAGSPLTFQSWIVVDES